MGVGDGLSLHKSLMKVCRWAASIHTPLAYCRVFSLFFSFFLLFRRGRLNADLVQAGAKIPSPHLLQNEKSESWLRARKEASWGRSKRLEINPLVSVCISDLSVFCLSSCVSKSNVKVMSFNPGILPSVLCFRWIQWLSVAECLLVLFPGPCS